MTQTEAKIQQDIFIWYNNTYCLQHHIPRCIIFSIPNEGKPELIRTGLYPGVSDLFIHHFTVSGPHYPMFVEVKTPTGTQKPAQKQFQTHVEALGYPYHIVRSLEDFKAVISGLGK